MPFKMVVLLPVYTKSEPVVVIDIPFIFQRDIRSLRQKKITVLYTPFYFSKQGAGEQ